MSNLSQWLRSCWVSEADPTYEQCDLCRGTGVVGYHYPIISPGVIPVTASDRRLRPRQTLFVVSISVGLTAIVAFVCLYLIFPRDLEMTYSREIETLSSYIPPEPPSAPGEKNVNVTLQDHITVTNNNFLAASVSSIELEVFYRGSFSGRAVVRNMIVPARDKLDVDVTVNVDQLTRDSARSMFKNCIFFPQMERLDFRMNVTVTVLSQNQNMFRKFSAFVDCKNTTEEEVFTYPRIPNFAQFGIDHT